MGASEDENSDDGRVVIFRKNSESWKEIFSIDLI